MGDECFYSNLIHFIYVWYYVRKYKFRPVNETQIIDTPWKIDWLVRFIYLCDRFTRALMTIWNRNQTSAKYERANSLRHRKERQWWQNKSEMTNDTIVIWCLCLSAFFDIAIAIVGAIALLWPSSHAYKNKSNASTIIVNILSVALSLFLLHNMFSI